MPTRNASKMGLAPLRLPLVRCAQFLIFLFGLTVPMTAIGQAQSSSAYAPWVDSPYVFRLGAGDSLSMRFPFDPELNSTIVIAPDGSASLPLIGSRRLAGFTADEIRERLKVDYAAILRHPDLDLILNAYDSSQIYVGGEVKDPGAKTVRGLLTIHQALMTAGGLLDTARARYIIVLRQAGTESKPHMLVVDPKSPNDDGALKVQPGDVIFVPKSAISEVDLFVKQYITSLIPLGFSLNVS